jgi:O-antigen/teichoic acid export membrane protein
MQKSFRANVAWSMVAVIVKNGFYVGTYMVLARLLDPSAFGLIAIVMVGMGLGVMLVDSGFTGVVVRERNADRSTLSSLYWFNIAMGLLAALVLAGSGPMVAKIYHDPRLIRMMLTAGIALLCSAMGQQFLCVLQREVAFRRIAFIEGASAFLAFGVATLRALHGAGVYSYYEGIVVANCFAAGTAIYFGRSSFLPVVRFRMQELRPFLNFGLFNTGERLITFAAFNLEKPLIGRLFDVNTLGLYTIVNQLVTRPIMFFSSALSRVAYPVLADLQTDRDAVNNFYLSNTGKLALITFPIYGFLFLFSDTVIPILFGGRFLPACAFVPPLCILGALWSIGNPFGSYLMALNRPKIGFYFNILAGCVTMGAILIGHRYAMQTMLWIWVAFVGGILLPLEWYIRFRLTRMSPLRYLGQLAPHVLLVAVLIVATVSVRRMLHLDAALMSSIVLMLLYCAAYGAYATVSLRLFGAPKKG